MKVHGHTMDRVFQAVYLGDIISHDGMLSSAESWYGLTKNEINEMEEVDKFLLRQILDAPSSSCIESLYLELGCMPIHVILKARRLNYLHYLVNLKRDEMLAIFFKTQWNYPCKGDWTIQVRTDLKDFGISDNLEEIKRFLNIHSKEKLKSKLKNLRSTIC